MGWFQRKNESKSDAFARAVSFPKLQEKLKSDQVKRRESQYEFNMISLAELTRHKKLPAFQSLNSLLRVPCRGLDVDDKIFLFISHRWHDDLVPDDGTLIENIMRFCLSLVVRNNFRELPQFQEVHASETLSQKLSALIGAMDPADVVSTQATFGRFDGAIASLSSDFIQIQLIREILSRFYLWIDFCCLPQVHFANGRRIDRTDNEDRIFLAGLDNMDTLLEKIETVILWKGSEFKRAWLLYESIMSIPRGRASFMMPMGVITRLAKLLGHYHVMFSQLSLTSLTIGEHFEKLGIEAASDRDMDKIILLMETNLVGTEWKARIIQ